MASAAASEILKNFLKGKVLFPQNASGSILENGFVFFVDGDGDNELYLVKVIPDEIKSAMELVNDVFYKATKSSGFSTLINTEAVYKILKTLHLTDEIASLTSKDSILTVKDVEAWRITYENPESLDDAEIKIEPLSKKDERELFRDFKADIIAHLLGSENVIKLFSKFIGNLIAWFIAYSLIVDKNKRENVIAKFKETLDEKLANDIEKLLSSGDISSINDKFSRLYRRLGDSTSGLVTLELSRYKESQIQNIYLLQDFAFSHILSISMLNSWFSIVSEIAFSADQAKGRNVIYEKFMNKLDKKSIETIAKLLTSTEKGKGIDYQDIEFKLIVKNLFGLDYEEFVYSAYYAYVYMLALKLVFTTGLGVSLSSEMKFFIPTRQTFDILHKLYELCTAAYSVFAGFILTYYDTDTVVDTDPDEDRLVVKNYVFKEGEFVPEGIHKGKYLDVEILVHPEAIDKFSKENDLPFTFSTEDKPTVIYYLHEANKTYRDSLIIFVNQGYDLIVLLPVKKVSRITTPEAAEAVSGAYVIHLHTKFLEEPITFVNKFEANLDLSKLTFDEILDYIAKELDLTAGKAKEFKELAKKDLDKAIETLKEGKFGKSIGKNQLVVDLISQLEVVKPFYEHSRGGEEKSE